MIFKNQFLTDASPDELYDTLSVPGQDSAFRLDIEEVMLKLTSAQRQIVTLHINGSLGFRDIAEITHEPLGTVPWRHQSAMSKLCFSSNKFFES